MINNISRTLPTILLSFLFIFSPVEAARPMLSAFVDKTKIETGESVVLTVEYSGLTKEKPDISGIEDFSIISRQESTESSFINGDFSQKTSWTFALLPQSSESVLIIPAITLGSLSTSPIQITQSKVSGASRGQEGVFLKVTTDKKEVYINGQLILNIELKTTLPIKNGTLNQPEIADAIVEPLIRDGQKEVIEGGIKYIVFHRSYAIFPTKPGTLRIPSIIFDGIAISGRDRAWPGFFSSGTRVTARSEDMDVHVKDVPEGWPKGHHFLPAKNLVIIESLDEKFEVNQASARKFEIKALGTLSTFLPTIKEPDVLNLRVYSEQGSKEQIPTENGIEAKNVVSQIYMPTVSGPMLIPEQVIYWWDTENDKLKTMAIRELQIDVTGTAKAKPALSPPQDVDLERPSEPQSSSKHYLVLAAIILLLLVVLSSLYFWQRKRAKNLLPKPSDKEVLKAMVKNIVSSCKRGDEKQCYRHLQKLLAWHEQKKLVFLGEELLKKTDELSKHLYHPKSNRADAELLGEIKKLVLKIRLKRSSDEVLLPIYPA